MKANGKLTKEEKRLLKDMKADLKRNKGYIDYSRKSGITMVICPDSCYMGKYSDFDYVSIAYTHPRDKFRKKVGQYVALDRFFNGECIRLAMPEIEALTQSMLEREY